jgi:hypothetical protein
MTVKDLVRPLPGVRQLSLLRQRLGFTSSAAYWGKTYASGGMCGIVAFRRGSTAIARNGASRRS